MKRLSVLFAVVLSLCLIGGLEAGAGEKKYKLGLCMSSLDTFLSSLADAATEKAKEMGMELVLMDALDDSIRQTDQVNTLLDECDAVIIVIVETSSAPPMVSAARRAGKPLVFVNRNPFFGREVPANNYVLSANTRLEGATGMDYVGQKLNGEGNIVILMGTLGHEAAINRSQGVKDMITEKYPNIKVIDEQTGNWFRDQGMTVMENLITAHGDKINGVCANNDEMALGASLALQARGIRDKVVVVGVDGTADGIQGIMNGVIDATAYQDPFAQGAGSVEIAVDVLNGKTVQATNTLPVMLVTKANAKEFQR